MLLGSMLGAVSAYADTPATEEAKLDIGLARLEFATTIYLLIGVRYTGVYGDKATAEQKVTITVDGEPLSVDTTITGLEDGYVGFKYKKLGAKNIGDELIIKAFADGVEQDSTAYSVLEYTITARRDCPDNAELMTVVDRLLAFGAAAQSAFEYEGDYDLTKAHTLTKLVGGVNPSTGASKVILEEGRSVAIEADSDDSAGYYWYNPSLTVRASSASKSAELSYTDKNETLFAVAKNRAVFMDQYTGETVYYYAFGESKTLRYVDRDRKEVENPAPAFHPINFGAAVLEEPAKLANITDVKGTGTINAGYIMYRGTLNPNIGSEAVGERVAAFISAGYTKFTLSYTMATTDNNTPKCPFGYVSLRNGASTAIAASTDTTLKSKGMLYLIRGDYNNTAELRTGSSADATVTKYSGALKIVDVQTSGYLNGTNLITNPSDFFTVNMVITLAGSGEYGTIEYYLNDATKPVATVRHYASDSFFSSSLYLCTYLSGSNTGYRSYLKNVVVTPGDLVNDYD